MEILNCYERDLVSIPPPIILTHYDSIFDPDVAEYFDTQHRRFIEKIADFCRNLDNYKKQSSLCSGFYCDYEDWIEKCTMDMNGKIIELEKGTVDLYYGNGNLAQERISALQELLRESKRLCEKFNVFDKNWLHFNQIYEVRMGYDGVLITNLKYITDDWNMFQEMYPKNLFHYFENLQRAMETIKNDVSRATGSYTHYVRYLNSMQALMDTFKMSQRKFLKPLREFEKRMEVLYLADLTLKDIMRYSS